MSEAKVINIFGQAFLENCQVVGVKVAIHATSGIETLEVNQRYRQGFRLVVAAVLNNSNEVVVTEKIILEAIKRDEKSNILETGYARLEQLAGEGFTEKQSVAFGEELLKYADVFGELPISELKDSFNEVMKLEHDLWR